MRVISLGGGVQSSAMLLMALEGRFSDVPDCAVFADPQWESRATYEWLRDLCGIAIEQIPSSNPRRYRAIPGTYIGGVARFTTHVVTAGSVRDSALRASVGAGERGDGRFTTMPVFLKAPPGLTPVFAGDPDGFDLTDEEVVLYRPMYPLGTTLEDVRRDFEQEVVGLAFVEGGAGMGRRQCTAEFKLKPLYSYLRSMGATAENPVESWIGISTDEAARMKPSRVRYARNRYPLIDAGLSREACDQYLMNRVGRSAPKSACIGCPFQGEGSWARRRETAPDEYEDACFVDDHIRVARGLRAQQYLHRSLVPLRDINEFRNERQGRMFFDAFGNECEGVCGV